MAGVIRGKPVSIALPTIWTFRNLHFLLEIAPAGNEHKANRPVPFMILSPQVLFARIGGFLGIDAGADYDEINVFAVHATVASIRAGTGTAAIRVDGCEFRGDFAAFTDEGADFVSIANTRVMGTSYIISGGGGDYVLVQASRFAQLQWNTGAGFDFVDFRASIADEIFATLSEDADWLRLNYSVIDRGSVIGGNGFDLLTLEGSQLGTLGTDFEQTN